MRTLIQKGTVYDGTGAEGFAADVLVQDDKIEAVAPHIDAEVDTVIDAAGLAVAPGFIDTTATLRRSSTRTLAASRPLRV